MDAVSLAGVIVIHQEGRVFVLSVDVLNRVPVIIIQGDNNVFIYKKW